MIQYYSAGNEPKEAEDLKAEHYQVAMYKGDLYLLHFSYSGVPQNDLNPSPDDYLYKYDRESKLWHMEDYNENMLAEEPFFGEPTYYGYMLKEESGDGDKLITGYKNYFES